MPLQPGDWELPVDDLEYEDVDFSPQFPVDFHIYNDKFNYTSLARYYGDLVQPDFVPTERPRRTYEEVLEQVATHDDEEVAEEMVSALDPALLEMLQSMITPQVGAKEGHQFRGLLIKAFESTLEGVPASVRSVRLEPRGKEFVLLNKDADIICRGSYFEIVEYCHSYYPTELRYLIDASKQHITKIMSGSVTTMLKDSRAIRRLSPLLDKVTKASQLPFCESDHPIYRYNEADVEDESLPRYAVNEDPVLRLRTRIDHYLTAAEFIDSTELPKGVYYVNCLVGAADGSTGNNKKLLDKCIAIAPNNIVQAFIHLDNVELPSCIVVSKPRPHNLAATVEFDDEFGEPGKFVLDREFKSITTANLDRNRRIFGEFTYGNMMDGLPPETIDLAMGNFWRFRPRLKKEVPVTVRRKRTPRQIEMGKIGGDKQFDFSPELPHCDFYGVSLISDILHLNDPGQMSPEVCLRSLGILAARVGRPPVYISGVWRLPRI